ncbi:aldehyde dehydrogenase family protein [Rhizobacter sp. Root1221]|uniref:aldehyde dehydrogenase family protein n=1 Tax=Rhizobacter sp. Root1221 TaxID=1736433 RepID=UPI0006FAC7BC|nr:aldehyde dehydrogenase family protein [Rhizobacter sp. Root1221]KQV90443.1 hypothetical protein ASC87_28250 [Rhizobacter sp. Root1221]
MRLPLVIAGERVDSTNGVDNALTSRTGKAIAIPFLDEATVARLVAEPRDRLVDVPIHEIVSFLHNVGHNWKSREYARRRLYERYLCQCVGYSERMAETEANWIALFLSSHYRLYDTLAAELGAWQMLDSWVPREEALVRALPRGRVLHLVPGNVSLTSVVSILRAVVTKNVSVVKASSDDPMTPIALALSFADVDADHPVTKALSVVHWAGGQEAAHHRSLVQDADVVCAWGGDAAIAWARQSASPTAEVMLFGPRRSLAVIGRDANRRDAARALAHDVAMYDQRACFSVQNAFIEGPIAPFVEEIEAAFRNYAQLLPKGVHDFDERAGGALANLHSSFAGDVVLQGAERSWSVVVSPSHPIDHHPLGRTLYLHEVDAAADVADFIGPDVQTVAVYPESLAVALRDVCVVRGAARVVELGLNNVFRVGGAHDGVFPLQRLVRFVSMELPSRVNVKGIAVRIDQTTFLEENRFQEFIP